MAEIAAIIPYKIYPYNSGGQKSIALFYEFFSLKTPVFLICTSNNEKPADVAYQLAPLLGSSVVRYVNPVLFFRLRSFIKNNGIKVLIVEQPYFGWLAFLLKKSTGISIVVRSHNLEGLRFKGLNKWWWKIMWHYEKWTYVIADQVFFIQQNDQQYAIKNFGLQPGKTAVITSGINWNEPPDAALKNEAKQALRKLHNIAEDEKILFFNGAFDYKPNKDALETIINVINPKLQAVPAFRYKIIVCGRGIPENFYLQNSPNIILTGFAKDISIYYLGANIFVNPVVDGGGIKTKLVEALGYDLTSVSTINGAIGIDQEICNGKLIIVPNDDWSEFADKILSAANIQSSISKDFFDFFYWGNIIEKALAIITQKVYLNKRI